MITHEANRAFYEKAWAAPRTLSPDRLAKSAKPATFETVRSGTGGGPLTKTGANSRRLDLHVLEGNPHNEQTLVVYFPGEKLLFQSDMINPPAAGAGAAADGDDHQLLRQRDPPEAGGRSDRRRPRCPRGDTRRSQCSGRQGGDELTPATMRGEVRIPPSPHPRCDADPR